MGNWKIEVQPTGNTFGVFGIADGQSADLIEGGFLSKSAAEKRAATWTRRCLQSEVEDAERRAGWDGRA